MHHTLVNTVPFYSLVSLQCGLYICKWTILNFSPFRLHPEPLTNVLARGCCSVYRLHFLMFVCPLLDWKMGSTIFRSHCNKRCWLKLNQDYIAYFSTKMSIEIYFSVLLTCNRDNLRTESTRHIASCIGIMEGDKNCTFRQCWSNTYHDPVQWLVLT